MIVCLGLAAVTALTVVALCFLQDRSNEVVALMGAAFTVTGTLVGTYFGVRIASDGADAAVAGMQAQSLRAQTYAAHVHPDKALDAEKAAANRPTDDPALVSSSFTSPPRSTDRGATGRATRTESTPGLRDCVKVEANPSSPAGVNTSVMYEHIRRARARGHS